MGMRITWKLRMAAAQREVWTGAHLRRLLAERAGLELSSASVSALFTRQPSQIKLTTLAALCTPCNAAARSPLQPTGITLSRLPEQARGQVRQLLGIYLDRLAPGLADGEHRATDSKVTFGWAGGLLAGDAHYYRIQEPGLLIEYGNGQRPAGHAHTVLRRPGRDFGASLLASHLAAERP
jgi:hypothetical protein